MLVPLYFMYFRDMLLEICANSYQSAIAAQKAGAQRIELCSELALGGITPSHGLIEKVVTDLEIPVYVLIRPRSGDFTYYDDEFDVMLRDIAFCRNIKVAGVVSGVLQSDLTIDEERTQTLVDASGGMTFTFHRAFDWTPNAMESLKTLQKIGVDRILTSGQSDTALSGLFVLKMLLEKSNNKPVILPGGGIRPSNIGQFIAAGFKEIHASASNTIESLEGAFPMHNLQAVQQDLQTYSDPEKIKELLEAMYNS